MLYCPTIGLEIHVELRTKSKMFCACLNDPDEKHPNINICPVCMGHPGTLPVINQEAVKKVLKTGAALNCELARHSKFDRKNYFYPDLPKGYQISQYDEPFCKKGFLEIEGRKIKIKRIHLEEDTGRLVHLSQKGYSLVDFNRAGIPLMELVTEPDINSAREARRFAQELHLILRYLRVSEANMEKGQMRVEANISLHKKGEELGTKVEIKNLNSFRVMEKAIDYEIKRQTDVLEQKKKVVQETRGWDEKKEITVSQRRKEEAHDYRYFPEPDLPSLSFSKSDIERIESSLPELPQSRRKRFQKEYSLEEETVEFFVQNKELGEYLEKVISEFGSNLSDKQLKELIKLVVNYMMSDLQGILKKAGVSGEEFRITPENFAEFISLIKKGQISSRTAKKVLTEMFETGGDPSHIIEEKDLIQITDQDFITSTASNVVSENSKAVADFKSGKKESLQYLIGKMMQKTKGRADPEAAKKALLEQLSSK